MKSEKDKLHSGELYLPNDEEIQIEQRARLDKLFELNHTRDFSLREKMLKEMCGSIGENCYIELPVYSNFGLKHVYFGNEIYVNFGCTFVDDTYIYVGDNTMFGPNCVIATPSHPINNELRKKTFQYNFPVKIGQNCWLGAGVIVLPGVTIGDNVVVGAGSVVTKDLPSNTVCVGNPCRVMRSISEEDKKYYFKKYPIDPKLFE